MARIAMVPPASTAADNHAHELQVRLINEDRVRLAGNPDVRREERGDDEGATGANMLGHRGD